MEQYDKYKPSGVEWIGAMPEHWEVKKIKYSDEIIMGQSPSSDDYSYAENGLPFIQGNAEFSELHPKPKLWCSSANKIALIDDILLSVRAPIGAVNIANQKIGIGRGLCLIRPKFHHKKYLYYFILFSTDELNSIGTGSTYTAVSAEEVKNLFILNPSADEQTAIANYLDEKTAQIDSLIGNKEKLIELLKEERTAVINQAVTRGIDPHVKRKASGIDWLGNIPEHWEVKNLKYLLKSTKDALKPGPFGSDLKNSDLTLNGNYKVYTQRNIIENNFEIGEDFISDYKFELLKAFEIFENDVLITSRGTIGRAAIFPKGLQKGILHPCLIRLQIDQLKTQNQWLTLYFNESSYFIENVKLNSNSTVIDVIYGYTLRDVLIPLPPLEEQNQIVQHIETETKRIDSTISKIKKEIELLQEYRTALISEVVTGKIKVI
jgi:type I restriction enzyme S subunit